MFASKYWITSFTEMCGRDGDDAGDNAGDNGNGNSALLYTQLDPEVDKVIPVLQRAKEPTLSQ